MPHRLSRELSRTLNRLTKVEVGAGDPDEDPRLIRQCLDGHADAFAVLVRKYQDRLYNTVLRLVGNTEDARDTVQDVFVQAYRSLGRFQGQSAFYTWLYRIAVNAAISLKRRQRVTVPIDTGRHAGGLEPADDPERSDPAARLKQQEVKQQVHEALASLPEEFRAVLVLKEIEGQKYETIAQILDCPIGTVRSRLHRARIELRERLKDVMEEQ